jgi:ABC-2 type transport system permease protein
LRTSIRRTPIKPLFIVLTGALFLAIETFIFYRVFHFLFHEVDPSVRGLSRALSLYLLRLLFLIFGIMLFYSNLVTAVSVYLTANDMKLLLVLPVRNRALYLSKFFETLTRSSTALAVFMIPALATYGVAREAHPSFYVGIPFLLILFLCIPSAVAVPAMLALARIFPARRLQQGLLAVGLLATTAGLFAFRMLRIEDYFAAQGGADKMIRWASAAQFPQWTWAPGTWLVQSLELLVEGAGPGHWAARLAVCAGGTLALSVLVGSPILRGTWSRAFGTPRRKFGGGNLFRFGHFSIPGLSRADSAMALKELKVFTRDLSRWSQIVMMIPLIGFYLLNMYMLPFRESFQALYFLLNLFMISFIMAAIGARYLFPSISWEGPALWLLRVSPYPVWRLVAIKFLVFSLPLLGLTVALVLFSSRIFDFPEPAVRTSLVLSLGTTLFLAGLAIGFGSLLPRFRYEHHLEISLGPGGLLYMLTALVISFLFLLLMSYPIFAEMGKDAWNWGNWNFSTISLPSASSQRGWLGICFLGMLVSLGAGVVSLARREEFDR